MHLFFYSGSAKSRTGSIYFVINQSNKTSFWLEIIETFEIVILIQDIIISKSETVIVAF